MVQKVIINDRYSLTKLIDWAIEKKKINGVLTDNLIINTEFPSNLYQIAQQISNECTIKVYGQDGEMVAIFEVKNIRHCGFFMNNGTLLDYFDGLGNAVYSKNNNLL